MQRSRCVPFPHTALSAQPVDLSPNLVDGLGPDAAVGL